MKIKCLEQVHVCFWLLRNCKCQFPPSNNWILTHVTWKSNHSVPSNSRRQCFPGPKGACQFECLTNTPSYVIVFGSNADVIRCSVTAFYGLKVCCVIARKRLHILSENDLKGHSSNCFQSKETIHCLREIILFKDKRPLVCKYICQKP